VDFRLCLSHLHQLQVFFLLLFLGFGRFLKNWSLSYLRVMLIKMGPNNEDI
jgi:hypothetical protein